MANESLLGTTVERIPPAAPPPRDTNLPGAYPAAPTTQQPSASYLNYDPSLPVYAQPETVNTQTALQPLGSADSYIDPSKATVQGQVAGILQNGSPLLSAAQATSNQAYNARGLLNSGAGVRAGTAAVIDKALQIATPDAALYGDMSKQNQLTTNNAAANNQLAGIEQKKSENNALISGALTTQDYAGKQLLQNVSDQSTMARLEFDNQWKNYINNVQLDAETKKNLSAYQAQAAAELSGSIERILRDPNISDGDAKVAAVQAMTKIYQNNFATTAALAGVNFSWD